MPQLDNILFTSEYDRKEIFSSCDSYRNPASLSSLHAYLNCIFLLIEVTTLTGNNFKSECPAREIWRDTAKFLAKEEGKFLMHNHKHTRQRETKETPTQIKARLLGMTEIAFLRRLQELNTQERLIRSKTLRISAGGSIGDG